MKSIAVVALASSALADEPSFEEWTQAYGKSYNGDEAERARSNYESNVQYINEINAQNLGYTLGSNQFSDLSHEEFASIYLGGYKPSARFGGAPKLGEHVHDGSPLADSVDWVSQGAVTAIKDQGQCGSCWAFSTTGSTEGAYKIAGGRLTSLSEQQLVDCSKANNGCQGGSMESAFTYLKGDGSCTETSYPYRGVGGTCQASSCTKALTAGQVSGYQKVGSFFGATEQDLMSAVAKNPVSIAIEADQRAFQSYKNGVLSGPCGTNLDHGVLAVGYGTSGNQNYWKIKNSWGTSWGEAGYGLLLRGSNQCGILGDASYPEVSASAVAV